METTVWVVSFGNGIQLTIEVKAKTRAGAKAKLQKLYPNGKGFDCQSLA